MSSSPTPQLSVLWTYFKIYLEFETEVNEFLKYFDTSAFNYLETVSTIFLLLRYNYISYIIYLYDYDYILYDYDLEWYDYISYI